MFKKSQRKIFNNSSIKTGENHFELAKPRKYKLYKKEKPK